MLTYMRITGFKTRKDYIKYPIKSTFSTESDYLSKNKWSEVTQSVWLFVTPRTVAHQSPQSMGFSRQEYWSGLPFPSPGDPPNPGTEPRSPALQADALRIAGRCFTVWATREASSKNKSTINELMVATGEEWEKHIVRKFGMDMYTLPYLKWVTNKVLLYSTWNSDQCYVAAWVREDLGGKWTHVR